MRIKEYLINRKSMLEKEVDALEKFIAHVPEGTLVERYQRGGYVFTKRVLNKENSKEEKLNNRLIETSEGDIISRLVHFGVPFRYEDAVMTKHGIYHPDIHLKSIADGNDWYWEHLGAMDSYKYRNDNYSRLKDLNDIGIIQWKNLIITTETEDCPLDIRWVDEIIKYYLL